MNQKDFEQAQEIKRKLDQIRAVKDSISSQKAIGFYSYQTLVPELEKLCDKALAQLEKEFKEL